MEARPCTAWPEGPRRAQWFPNQHAKTSKGPKGPEVLRSVCLVWLPVVSKQEAAETALEAAQATDTTPHDPPPHQPPILRESSGHARMLAFGLPLAFFASLRSAWWSWARGLTQVSVRERLDVCRKATATQNLCKNCPSTLKRKQKNNNINNIALYLIIWRCVGLHFCNPADFGAFLRRKWTYSVVAQAGPSVPSGRATSGASRACHRSDHACRRRWRRLGCVEEAAARGRASVAPEATQAACC